MWITDVLQLVMWLIVAVVVFVTMARVVIVLRGQRN